MKRTTKTQKKQKMLLIASLAFVAVMIVASIALIMADDGGIAVNTFDNQTAPTFSLDDGTSIADDLLETMSMNDEQLDYSTLEELDMDQLFSQTPTEEVPEPATMSLLAIGGVAMMYRRRRNRK